MQDLAYVVVSAASVYVATSIENLPVLLAFFADEGYTGPEVFVGQSIGMGLLVGISLLGSRVATLLPQPVVGLLGLVPSGSASIDCWPGQALQSGQAITGYGLRTRPLWQRRRSRSSRS
jgi:Cadmium resistance transporter